MLSKTIRNAASGNRDGYFEVKINEFDLETWAHEARKLEEDVRVYDGNFRTVSNVCEELRAENTGLREALDGHDRQALLTKAKRLKGTDGEGWAIGELVERILGG